MEGLALREVECRPQPLQAVEEGEAVVDEWNQVRETRRIGRGGRDAAERGVRLPAFEDGTDLVGR
jgi:hypothetical protein